MSRDKPSRGARPGAALERLRADVTGRKMFLNGGVSAIPRGWL